MNEQRNYNQDVVEIDLKELLICLLDKWIPIILTACIFAVLLGGFKFVGAYRDYRSAQAETTDGQTEDEAMAIYEQQKSGYELRIEMLQKLTESQQKYLEESALMALDPDNFYEATLSYYITTNYQIDPNLSMQNTDKTIAVLNAYRTLLNNGEFYQYVRDNIQESISSKNLQELIYIEVGDANNGRLQLTFIGESQALVSDIMEAARGYIETCEGKVTGSVAEHELHFLNESTFNTQDAEDIGYVSRRSDVRSKQDSAVNTITGYQNQITDIQKKINDLKEPTSDSGSKADVLKAAVKFAVIGFVLGGFLGCAAFALAFIFTNPLVNEDVVERRLGLVVLGSRKRFIGKGLFSKFNSYMAGDKLRQVDLSACTSFAAANLDAILAKEAKNIGNNEKRNVLVIGSDPVLTKEVAEKMNDQTSLCDLTAVGDILVDSMAIQEVKDIKSVLIVEELGKTSYEILRKESEKLNVLGKIAVGVVLG